MALTAGTRLGPYEVLGLIGAGGMGEVYRARDTRLGRTVAIKILPGDVASDPERRRRFEQEARTVSALDHPNICVLYDIGSDRGIDFLVMEYVEGQPLSSLIPPNGLPILEFLRIAIQLTDAVNAARERGIVHRDLKPTNVLVNEEGRAKVLDFGLALLRPQPSDQSTTPTVTNVTAEGRISGTVSYMSPEQAEGRTVDHRSDIFSLGVMFYEMATGQRPFKGNSPISVVSSILKDTPRPVTEVNGMIPPELARVIRRCLEKRPTARFQSALDLRHELEDLQDELQREHGDREIAGGVPPGRARMTMKRAVALWLGPVVLLLAIVTSFVLGGGDLRTILWFTDRPALALGERDTVLLAQVDNSTGDPSLEGSVGTALEISLEQSPLVSLLSPDRVRQALRRMGRSDGEKLTQDLAREVCQRAGSHALIAAAVARVAEQYVLTVRIVDPSTGNTVRTVTERVDSRDRILPAIDKLAAAVRRLLGESLGSIAAANVKLAEATTSSLEALQNYSEGAVLLDRGRREDARSSLTRAVELDPEFALAHAALASTYRGYGYHLNDAKAEQHFQEALKRLDRVSERERLEIQALYHGVVGHYEQAVSYHRQLVERYPRDAAYHFALSQEYRILGRKGDAITEGTEALQLNPSSPRIMLTLAAIHGDLRQWGQMIDYYERAFGVEPELATDQILNHQYGWALVQVGRPDAAKAAFQKMLDLEPAKKARGHRSLAILALYHGELRAARRELEEARRLNETSGAADSAARDIYYLAEALVVLGRAAEANAELTRVTAMSSKAGWMGLSLRVSTLLARNGRYSDASRIVSSKRKQATASDSYDRADLLRAEGEIALGQGRAAEAVELAKQAVAVQPWILTRTSLARALDRAGQKAEAIAEYEAIVASGPEPWEGHVEWAVGHLALARLYERAGRLDDARRTCEQLRNVWKNADADMPPARQLSATLSRIGAK